MVFFLKKCVVLNVFKMIICFGCMMKDEYYDYQGVFKGVIEGVCDVGFMKFIILVEYVFDGIKVQNWIGLERLILKVFLCSLGLVVCGDLFSFVMCNFGLLVGNLF